MNGSDRQSRGPKWPWMAVRADAHKQRQQQEQQQEPSGVSTDSGNVSSGLTQADPVQRQTLKFGFSSKPGVAKASAGSAVKKPKLALKVSSVFGNDSDEES